MICDPQKTKKFIQKLSKMQSIDELLRIEKSANVAHVIQYKLLIYEKCKNRELINEPRSSMTNKRLYTSFDFDLPIPGFPKQLLPLAIITFQRSLDVSLYDFLNNFFDDNEQHCQLDQSFLIPSFVGEENVREENQENQQLEQDNDVFIEKPPEKIIPRKIKTIILREQEQEDTLETHHSSLVKESEATLVEDILKLPSTSQPQLEQQEKEDESLPLQYRNCYISIPRIDLSLFDISNTPRSSTTNQKSKQKLILSSSSTTNKKQPIITITTNQPLKKLFKPISVENKLDKKLTSIKKLPLDMSKKSSTMTVKTSTTIPMENIKISHNQNKPMSKSSMEKKLLKRLSTTTPTITEKKPLKLIITSLLNGNPTVKSSSDTNTPQTKASPVKPPMIASSPVLLTQASSTVSLIQKPSPPPNIKYRWEECYIDLPRLDLSQYDIDLPSPIRSISPIQSANNNSEMNRKIQKKAHCLPQILKKAVNAQITESSFVESPNEQVLLSPQHQQQELSTSDIKKYVEELSILTNDENVEPMDFEDEKQIFFNADENFWNFAIQPSEMHTPESTTTTTIDLHQQEDKQIDSFLSLNVVLEQDDDKNNLVEGVSSTRTSLCLSQTPFSLPNISSFLSPTNAVTTSRPDSPTTAAADLETSSSLLLLNDITQSSSFFSNENMQFHENKDIDQMTDIKPILDYELPKVLNVSYCDYPANRQLLPLFSNINSPSYSPLSIPLISNSVLLADPRIVPYVVRKMYTLPIKNKCLLCPPSFKTTNIDLSSLIKKEIPMELISSEIVVCDPRQNALEMKILNLLYDLVKHSIPSDICLKFKDLLYHQTIFKTNCVHHRQLLVQKLEQVKTIDKLNELELDKELEFPNTIKLLFH
ncbi:unnamed protein product [Didymodactylos carnosus]|uniref:Uncharacterized protein n=1 Tax=Didymodactylos carnosus TaxID=1234261 RepID=A0A814V759_9BILA|nr:unnamed protein product [Didymodactylos carnosus]CAF1188098.1 unnamed protein product [Didymodactylos carnosus]CAF3948544.1 unnamed protein product [Didymodactylos carnosus]CAF3999257.1 unnamed protein product [Didymodactylos carnosus]